MPQDPGTVCLLNLLDVVHSFYLIYGIGPEEVGHASSSISRWVTLLKFDCTTKDGDIDTCDCGQVCKSCGQDTELYELYKLSKLGYNH